MGSSLGYTVRAWEARRRRPRFLGRRGMSGLLAVLLLFLAGAGAGAEAPEEDCDPETWICVEVFEEDPEAITARWDNATKTWIAEPPNGYVRIRHKGDTVTARRLLLREEEEYARLEGEVRLVRDDLRSESETLDLWWEREEYVFTGGVMLVQLDEAVGEQDGEEGTGGEQAPGREKKEVRTIWAQRLEYRRPTGEVTATGDAHMVDDQYRVWAQQMIYQEKPETMTFLGQVRVQAADSQWTMTGEHFFYDIEKEQGHLIGPHRMTVMPEDEKN